MKRVEDWPERLLAFVEARREMPFKWGENDCCSFAADAVLEMTGEDLMASLRGRYNSSFSAAVRIEREGGIEHYLDIRLPEMAPRLAHRGDLVMFDAVEGPALGVVLGSHAAAAGPEGVTWIPMARWRKAWRVGGIV